MSNTKPDPNSELDQNPIPQAYPYSKPNHTPNPNPERNGDCSDGIESRHLGT